MEQEIAIVQYKLAVEDYKGLMDFENFSCRADQDVKNEYLRMRFIQDHKNIRPLPKSVDVHSSYIRRWEDQDGRILRMGVYDGGGS